MSQQTIGSLMLVLRKMVHVMNLVSRRNYSIEGLFPQQR